MVTLVSVCVHFWALDTWHMDTKWTQSLTNIKCWKQNGFTSQKIIDLQIHFRMLEHILIFSFINISRNIISACLAPYPTIVINPNLFQNQNSIIFYNNWKHLFAKPYAYPKFQFLLHISENQTKFPLVLLGAKSRKPLLTCRESPPSQPVNKKPSLIFELHIQKFFASS